MSFVYPARFIVNEAAAIAVFLPCRPGPLAELTWALLHANGFADKSGTLTAISVDGDAIVVGATFGGPEDVVKLGKYVDAQAARGRSALLRDSAPARLKEKVEVSLWTRDGEELDASETRIEEGANTLRFGRTQAFDALTLAGDDLDRCVVHFPKRAGTDIAVRLRQQLVDGKMALGLWFEPSDRLPVVYGLYANQRSTDGVHFVGAAALTLFEFVISRGVEVRPALRHDLALLSAFYAASFPRGAKSPQLVQLLASELLALSNSGTEFRTDATILLSALKLRHIHKLDTDTDVDELLLSLAFAREEWPSYLETVRVAIQGLDDLMHADDVNSDALAELRDWRNGARLWWPKLSPNSQFVSYSSAGPFWVTINTSSALPYVHYLSQLHVGVAALRRANEPVSIARLSPEILRMKGAKKSGQKAIAKARARRKERARIPLRKSDRPRLCVLKSSKHNSAQIIDDCVGKTLAAASTQEPRVRARLLAEGVSTKSKAAARIVGQLVAERASVLGVRKVVFDRGQRIYSGRVKSLADGARDAGLDF